MIKKGLKVKVIAGKDKKKEGEVIEIDRQNNRAKVKEINMVKKHVKTTKEKKGGIISKESFIHLSNLKLIQEKAKVKGINIIKKHEKTTKEKKGGIISKESFINLSNLKLIDEKVKSKKVEAKK